MKKLYNLFCAVILLIITLSASAQQATLMLNEINPNISSSHDLVELVAVTGGSVNGFTIEQAISSPVVLATLPQVNVSAGDIIVVHLNPATATGAAPASETISKSEYPSVAFSANYDNAWDFHGGATGITYSNRVFLVRDSAGAIQDVVPLTNNGGAPAAYPGDVVTVQGQNLWNPSDCSGFPCSYVTIPTVESISVNWQGSGTSPTGNSAQRMNSTDNNINSDWTSAPQAQTWGVLNVGQSVLFNEKDNSLSMITVFPNPLINELKIQNAELKIKEVEIYNLLGEKRLSLNPRPASPSYGVTYTKGDELRIDVSSLPSGIYFVRVKTEDGIQVAKFIVE